MSTTFICPECSNTMRTSTGVTSGKSIRCPKCNTSFAAPDGNAAENSSAATATTTQQELSGTAATKPNAMRGRFLVGLFSASFVALLAGSFLVTAFVWPGFMNPPQHADAGQTQQLTDYLPKDAEFAIRISMKTGRHHMIGLKIYELLLNPQFRQKRPKGFSGSTTSLVAQSDQVLLTGKFRHDGPQLRVFHAKRTFEFEELNALMRFEHKRKANRVTYYRTRRGGFVVMPNKKVLLFGRGDESAFHDLLAKQYPPQAMLTRIRSVQQYPIWLVVLNKGTIRETLDEMHADDLSYFRDLASTLPILRRSKAATLWCEFKKSRIKIRAQLTCDDAKDAGDLCDMVNSFWNQNLKPLFATGFLIQFLPKEFMQHRFVMEQLAPVTMDLAKTMQITAKDAQVVIAAELSDLSVQSLTVLPISK